MGGGGGGGGGAGLGLNYRNTEKKYSKSSSSEPLGSGAWTMVCSMAWWSFTKFVQMPSPGSKVAPPQGVPSLNHRKIYKNIQNFFRTTRFRCLKFGM